MNKFQAEKKFYAFHAVFRVDVNYVKPFQNPTGRSQFNHFLDPQSMPRLFETIKQYQTLLFLVYCGGQAGYAHIKRITQAIITLDLL